MVSGYCFVNPFNRWTFFVSADLFSFPWWRYSDKVKASKEWICSFQADYVPSKTVDMYVNYRYKQKERDVTGTQGKVILPTYHHRLRYRLNYLPCSLYLSGQIILFYRPIFIHPEKRLDKVIN